MEYLRGKAIADEAVKVINGERQDQYGVPENNFALIASLWSAYLGIKVTASDVAQMMVLFKIARKKGGAGSRDTFVDAVGYLLLGAEIDGHRD